ASVIVTAGAGPVSAVRQATQVIPIVFAIATDPVGTGLVTTLARPGGNITGLSYMGTDLAAKRLELLRAISTGLARLAIMADRPVALPAGRPSPHLYSIATSRPSIQPSARNRCPNAATNWLSDDGMPEPRNPMVGTLGRCCARAASGHAAAPPNSVMNSRRPIIRLSRRRGRAASAD